MRRLFLLTILAVMDCHCERLCISSSSSCASAFVIQSPPAADTLLRSGRHQATSLSSLSIVSSNKARKTQRFPSKTVALFSSNNSNNNVPRRDEGNEEASAAIPRFQQSLILQALLNASSPLLQVQYMGTSVPLPTISLEKTIDCAVLMLAATTLQSSSQQPCLLLPLSNPRYVALLELLRQISNNNKPRLSRWQLLQWNAAVLVNRDDGLFDNLPYAEWWDTTSTTASTISAMRDAAQNPVLPQFHPGKRETYNRLLGKDWYRDQQETTVIVQNSNTKSKKSANSTSWTSPLLQNLQKQLALLTTTTTTTKKTQQIRNSENTISTALDNSTGMIEYDDFAADDGDNNKLTTTTTSDDDVVDDATAIRVLEKRILELQIRETQMNLAELDYKIAVATTMQADYDNDTTNYLSQLQVQRQTCVEQLHNAQEHLKQLKVAEDGGRASSSSPSFWNLDISGNNNDAYAQPDSTSQDDDDSNNKNPNDEYASPYAMLHAILQTQMKAEVIGTVLENASLLEGTTVLGGAIVLQRRTEKTTVRIAGETVRVAVETNNNNNDTVAAGETILVECHADEAIGMSMACSAPLYVEDALFQRASIMATKTDDDGGDGVWQTVDPELSVLMEGQAGNQSATERVLPIRLPRSTVSLFDAVTNPQLMQPTTTVRKELFPTDNPIQSLTEYDALTVDDKARTMMALSNFDGKLPRPRAVRSAPEILDTLLLPLIDEAVRTQYRIRDAKQRGDTVLLEQLQSSKSKRLIAKERAQQARESGEPEDVVARLEAEAEFYDSLRADVTQDEGSYSRFLDRDDWYERDRQRVSKNVDKSKFGNLLDGIE